MNNLRKQLNELLDKFEEELKVNSNTNLTSKIIIKAILKSKTFSEFKMCLRLYNRMNKIVYRKKVLLVKKII